jgi:hypothetical protein
MDHYISKPISSADLVRVIEDLFSEEG